MQLIWHDNILTKEETMITGSRLRNEVALKMGLHSTAFCNHPQGCGDFLTTKTIIRQEEFAAVWMELSRNQNRHYGWSFLY